MSKPDEAARKVADKWFAQQHPRRDGADGEYDTFHFDRPHMVRLLEAFAASMDERERALVGALQDLHDEFRTGGLCEQGTCRHPGCVGTWRAFTEAERLLKEHSDGN